MRFRQAQLPAGLEPFEFGELGRIAIVTGSGSNGEAVAAAKTGYLAAASRCGEKAGVEIDTGLEL
jgi:hypothetical protein